MKAVFHELHRAFHDPEAESYRFVNGVVWVLIIASILIFALESMVEIPVLGILDTIVLWLFVVEITLRVATYRPPELDFYDEWLYGARWHVLGRLRFLAHPLNLFDLMAVLAISPELRGLRALRLLRLVGRLRIFRYSDPLKGITRAFQDNGLLYVFAFSFLALCTLIGGLVLYGVEGSVNDAMQSRADGMWWALVTLTTVGFGDIAPVTATGRAVGAVLMVAGMFQLALFAGIVGHTMLNAVLMLREEQFVMANLLDHVVVCGYDAGSRPLLEALLQELGGTPNVVLFSKQERLPDVPPDFRWIRGDPTKVGELAKAHVSTSRVVVVVGSRGVPPEVADAQTILTVFTIRAHMAKSPLTKTRKNPLYVAAEIFDPENVNHALTAGADEVIDSSLLTFTVLAHAVAYPGTAALLRQLASPQEQTLYVGAAPEGLGLPASFAVVGQRLKQATGALLIGVRDESGDVLNPDQERLVEVDHLLIYVAAQRFDEAS